MMHNQKTSKVKNAQIKYYKTQKPPKMSLSLFCIDYLLLDMEPALKCDLYS